MKMTTEQSNVIPVSGGQVVPRGERRIGSILVQAGRLTSDGTERILKLQREHGQRFGDAGIQLQLITSEDLSFALARQFDCPYLLQGESAVSEQVVAAYAPFGQQALSLSALRGQLMLRQFDPSRGGRTLAIVSAGRRDGRSFLASNLAVVFSQVGLKTLLIDADMRDPVQHELFGLDNRNGLSALLADRSSTEGAIQRVAGLPALWVMPAGAQPPNPLELLARPLFPAILSSLVNEFEIILLDSPATTEHADAQNISAQAGSALIIARRNTSLIAQVRSAAQTVRGSGATVIGTVLNEY